MTDENKKWQIAQITIGIQKALASFGQRGFDAVALENAVWGVALILSERSGQDMPAMLRALATCVENQEVGTPVSELIQ